MQVVICCAVLLDRKGCWWLSPAAKWYRSKHGVCCWTACGC